MEEIEAPIDPPDWYGDRECDDADDLRDIERDKKDDDCDSGIAPLEAWTAEDDRQ